MSKKEVTNREDVLRQDLFERKHDTKQTLRDETLDQRYDEKTFGYKQLFLKLVFE